MRQRLHIKGSRVRSEEGAQRDTSRRRPHRREALLAVSASTLIRAAARNSLFTFHTQRPSELRRARSGYAVRAAKLVLLSAKRFACARLAANAAVRVLPAADAASLRAAAARG